MSRPSLLLFQWSCLSETSLTSALCSNNRWPSPRKVDHTQEGELAYCVWLSSRISSHLSSPHGWSQKPEAALNAAAFWAHLQPSCNGWSRQWLCPRCTEVSPRPVGWQSLRWSRRGCFWVRWAGPRTWRQWGAPRTAQNLVHFLPRIGRWRHPQEWSGWSPVYCGAKKQVIGK